MKFKINNTKILALATALVLGATSCKKELDLLPTDSFTEDKAFQNIADIQAGVNTVYARMGACSGNLYMSALLSDEAKLGAGNSGQGALTYRYQYNSDGTTGGDVIGAWSSYSSALHQINTVLPYIDKVSGDAEVKKDLRGQLLAMRGICHFYLMQSYCGRYNASAAGIPIVTYVNIFAKPARNTMGEVMSQIENDITTAQGLLSATASFSDLVINKTNLSAFQAKIALYKGDYQAAVDFATTVINSGVKALVSGTAYAGIWTDANQQELLFRVAYNTSSAIGGMWTTLGNDVYIAPSDKLNAAYGTGDNRKALFIGTVGGNRFVKKYE